MVWQQFRVRYPTGSLIADLITIHDGVFVVRAIVHIDGKIVATGLAAATTVEEAEDRAKSRALSILDLLPPEESPGLMSSSLPETPVLHPPTHLLSPSFPSTLSNSALEPTDHTPRNRELLSIDDRTEGSAHITAPTDDSDLMIKTTVEIRRLQWSNEQGRQHLETTYSKRSRQHLTREELLDFLQYLEAQPTP